MTRSRSLASPSQGYSSNIVEVSLIVIKIHVYKVLHWEETQVCFIHWSSAIPAQNINTISNNTISFFSGKKCRLLWFRRGMFFLLSSTFPALPPIKGLSEKHITTHDKLLNVCISRHTNPTSLCEQPPDRTASHRSLQARLGTCTSNSEPPKPAEIRLFQTFEWNRGHYRSP